MDGKRSPRAVFPTSNPAEPVLRDLMRRYGDLAFVEADIARAAEVFIEAFRNGGKLLVAGNGGSAADAEHFAAELLKGFCRRRPCGADAQERYGNDVANALQEGVPVIPLTSFVAFQTAWANDCDPDYNFAQLVHALGRPGDALLLISTSGNSPNLLHAANVARGKGIAAIGLTGPDGGRLRALADLCIRAPGDTVFRIQERHLPIYHALARIVEETFYGEA